MKKHNVYARVDEKFVKAVILYADSSKKLYYNVEATDKVANADLLNLFLGGIVIFMSDKYYTPVFYSSAGLVANDGTSTALTFTAAE